jgi:hypothetical protein
VVIRTRLLHRLREDFLPPATPPRKTQINAQTAVSASTEVARHTAPAKSHILIVQFQNISDTSVDALRDGKAETVIWPDRYKAGDVILPYSSIMLKALLPGAPAVGTPAGGRAVP